MRRSFLIALTFSAGCLFLAGIYVIKRVQTSPSARESLLPPSQQPDVSFLPTPQTVVDKMLELAEIKPGDVVYDLGCGDGRILVTAARKYGVKGVGFDIDPTRVKESLANVKSNQVEHLVTIKEADMFTLDLREATVVTLYLLPKLNVRLMPQLERLRPGSRILSYKWDMRGAKPVQVCKLSATDGDFKPTNPEGIDQNTPMIYKWVIPWEKKITPPEADVPYVATPQEVVDKMLELAEIKKGDVVYDLGCGDGRIVVTAARKYGVKGVGFDMNPECIKDSLANAKANQVEHLVTFKEADIFTLDLREASVVTLYLWPEVNARLMPQLEKLRPGSRIVSHDYNMPGAKPAQVYKMTGEYARKESWLPPKKGATIYRWNIPWEKETAAPTNPASSTTNR
jgi:ribosomal protein L11 methylase PrmA